MASAENLQDKNTALSASCSFFQAWLAWERWRIAYNLILLTEGLGLLLFLRFYAGYVVHEEPYLYGWELWRMVLLFGVSANVCYSSGPFLEGVWRLISHRCFGKIRYVLFGAGLAFSFYFVGALALRMYAHLEGYLH